MSVKGRACFSVHAHRVSMPEAECLAEDIDAAIEALRTLVPSAENESAAERVAA